MIQDTSTIVINTYLGQSIGTQGGSLCKTYYFQLKNTIQKAVSDILLFNYNIHTSENYFKFFDILSRK